MPSEDILYLFFWINVFIYRIILEPEHPLDIWSYRDAPVINLDDAHFIWETFPFEEPEVFEEEPELGPAPHIVFGNLQNRLLLMLSYRGKGNFDVTLSESKGKRWGKENVDRTGIRNLLDTFWNSERSMKAIKLEFCEKQSFFRCLFSWIFRRS